MTRRRTPIERRLMKMPPELRRKLLMHSYLAAGRTRSKRKGKRPMADDIEITIATDGAGVSRILAAEPRPCGICGYARTLFVGRNGSTRCYECDHGFAKAEQAMRREQLGTRASVSEENVAGVSL